MRNSPWTPVVILLLMVFFGCGIKGTSADEQLTDLELAHVFKVPANAVDISIDVKKSKLYWKGTKMQGLRSHEGTLLLKEGRLFFDNNKLVGGYLTTDMNGIGITDIPKHETTAIRNLSNHLKAEFDTKRYPTAHFDISKVIYHTKDSLTLSGNMTIKDVSRQIVVPLMIITSGDGLKLYQTEFVLNRFAWNIGKDGSWLEKRVVDADFSLKLDLITDQTGL